MKRTGQNVIAELTANNPLTAFELGEELSVTPASVRSTISRMKEAGHVFDISFKTHIRQCVYAYKYVSGPDFERRLINRSNNLYVLVLQSMKNMQRMSMGKVAQSLNDDEITMYEVKNAFTYMRAKGIHFHSERNGRGNCKDYWLTADDIKRNREDFDL